MRRAVLTRPERAETRTRRPASEADIGWFDVMLGERMDLRPLGVFIAERLLHGRPWSYWPSDTPRLWPLLEEFGAWFGARYPGRWADLTPPFPERLPDGSWRSREP